MLDFLTKMVFTNHCNKVNYLKSTATVLWITFRLQSMSVVASTLWMSSWCTAISSKQVDSLRSLQEAFLAFVAENLAYIFGDNIFDRGLWQAGRPPPTYRTLPDTTKRCWIQAPSKWCKWFMVARPFVRRKAFSSKQNISCYLPVGWESTEQYKQTHCLKSSDSN